MSLVFVKIRSSNWTIRKIIKIVRFHWNSAMWRWALWRRRKAAEPVLADDADRGPRNQGNGIRGDREWSDSPGGCVQRFRFDDAGGEGENRSNERRWPRADDMGTIGLIGNAQKEKKIKGKLLNLKSDILDISKRREIILKRVNDAKNGSKMWLMENEYWWMVWQGFWFWRWWSWESVEEETEEKKKK